MTPSLPDVALSLRQPWAWMVVYGGKNLENRKWQTARRGPFLIHASLGMTPAEYAHAVAFAKRAAPELVVPPMEALDRGGFIGRASITSILPRCADPESKAPFRPATAPQPPLALFPREPCPHPWHIPDQFAFVLEDVAPLPFLPWKGALQFFKVPEIVRMRLSVAAA